MMIRTRISQTLMLASLLFATVLSAKEPLRVLIVDGQNNHAVWPKSTAMMKAAMEQSGRFTVDISRTRFTWKANHYDHRYALKDGKDYIDGEPVTDPEFAPDFSQYDAVISNFGWKAAPWPKETQQAFEAFISNGGGFISVHAANNSFPQWPAYNTMIGVGGWGGRNEKSGPYFYFDEQGKLITNRQKGHGGGHGKQHSFVIEHRESKHPILSGMPVKWKHTHDELYHRLRGPAENMTIIASAFDSSEFGGSGKHEPVMMVIDYGKGRIFHTTLGHGEPAFRSVGFITTLLRGVEWAATGKVTLDIPENFPSENDAVTTGY